MEVWFGRSIVQTGRLPLFRGHRLGSSNSEVKGGNTAEPAVGAATTRDLRLP